MARLITANDLTERIDLQVRAAGQDAHGQESTTWSTLATVWAKAEPLRGRDFFAAAQTQLGTTVRFVIMYRGDLVGTMRVLWRGQPYDIQGHPIDIDGKRHSVELMCQSGVRDGR